MTSSDEWLVDTNKLAIALERFAQERDWVQFHSPKNLVMALTGEVGELNELFQWLTESQSMDMTSNETARQRVAEELADVLFYLVRIASVMGIDLNEAAQAKLAQNESKYPVAKARGSSKKYTDL